MMGKKTDNDDKKISKVKWYKLVQEFILISHHPSPSKMAEGKVQIMEAKQALEEAIATQDFGRAAELKEHISGLETTQVQLAAEVDQPSIREKEVRVEKVKLINYALTPPAHSCFSHPSSKPSFFETKLYIVSAWQKTRNSYIYLFGNKINIFIILKRHFLNNLALRH